MFPVVGERIRDSVDMAFTRKLHSFNFSLTAYLNSVQSKYAVRSAPQIDFVDKETKREEV
jgi:hypothetical protein